MFKATNISLVNEFFQGGSISRFMGHCQMPRMRPLHTAAIIANIESEDKFFSANISPTGRNGTTPSTRKHTN